MRQFKIGEDVLGRDGSRLGHVDRLVVDQGAHIVSHLVVGGRVVPLSNFVDAGPDGLAANLDEAELNLFPSHDEEPYREAGPDWEPPEGYSLHNFLTIASAILGQGPYAPPVQGDLTPGLSTSEITAGSPVWVSEKEIGHVVEVLTDDGGATVNLVMARPGLVGEHVLIPISKVIEVVGLNVHVDLTETDVGLLEPFEG